MKQADVRAIIRYLTHEEGGSHQAIYNGYRGTICYHGNSWMAEHTFPSQDHCLPGEEVLTDLCFLSRAFHYGKFHIGMQFEVLEGRRVVGIGKIESIYDLKLEKWNIDSLISTISDEVPKATYQETIKFKKELMTHLSNTLKGGEMLQVNPLMLSVAAPKDWQGVESFTNNWEQQLKYYNKRCRWDFASEEYEFQFIVWDKFYIIGSIHILGGGPLVSSD